MKKMMTRVSVNAEELVSPATGHGDAYIPSGSIPNVVDGTILDLRAACYSFGEILDLAAHHLVWIGEAQAVQARLPCGSVTVRAFLRERYGLCAGESEHGDRSDLKRFRLWLADARWRIRKVRAEDRRLGGWRCVQAMRGEVPGSVM